MMCFLRRRSIYGLWGIRFAVSVHWHAEYGTRLLTLSWCLDGSRQERVASRAAHC